MMASGMLWSVVVLGSSLVVLGVAIGAVRMALELERRNGTAMTEAEILNWKDQARQCQTTTQELNGRLQDIENEAQWALTRVGLVRFNAFDKGGPDTSFALALINDRGGGWVLSSVANQREVRLYLKDIQQLTSRMALNAEEWRAIGLASRRRRSGNEVPLGPSRGS